VAAVADLLELPGVGPAIPRVEEALRTAVTADDQFLTDIAGHLLSAGGKRIRPAVALVAASCRAAADPDPSDDVVQGAASVELVHLGSLYHDDVMDEAECRRGVESVNARWGNLVAILAGDFLLARASEIAASLGTEVAGLLAATIGRLCEGQVGELQTAFDVSRTEDAYLRSITGKTASLLSTAARIGALTSGLDRGSVDALTECGLGVGMVFQIVDDILDIVGTDESLGKPAGHDLVEGIYTLPVIHTVATGGPAADELRALLGQPVDEAERDKARDIVRSSGGVASSVAVGRRYAEQAAAAAGSLPPSPAASALAELGHHLLADIPSS
jgi:heptaprenyl diphosphate synthase